ncbi:hypothetical protein GRI58_04970 [Porphyrobacter algicida]|uniref:Regulatory protein RecX n=1 Tax=Qipengyuania algicida TaxID=1836209 RepID=A0A845ACJ3_9SPHN|nr:RecX family transcriptional regulator [Qipengyuania algicida]MXP28172.1 hypothetical protein [Qipengyuania algicida]
MSQPVYSRRRAKRKPQPLDPARMEELALAYVARFATSSGKLHAYLERKLRERGYVDEQEGGEPPDIVAVVTRFIDKGYVDDAGYARSKARGLLQRGYGARRVGQALTAAGIAPDLRAEVDPGEAERREAAIAYARRRRFGPYNAASAHENDGDSLERRKQRDKQVAAMLRAGHDLSVAVVVIDAATLGELDQWVAEVRE